MEVARIDCYLSDLDWNTWYSNLEVFLLRIHMGHTSRHRMSTFYSPQSHVQSRDRFHWKRNSQYSQRDIAFGMRLNIIWRYDLHIIISFASSRAYIFDGNRSEDSRAMTRPFDWIYSKLRYFSQWAKPIRIDIRFVHVIRIRNRASCFVMD